MGNFIKQVKRASHIHFFSCFHIQQCEVNCTAPAVAGLFCNIAFRKNFLFFQIRIEIRLHANILILNPPQDKVLHCTGRAIGIEHFQAITLNHHLIADSFQRPRGLLRQKCTGFLISIDTVSDKIVSRIVPDLLYDLRDVVRQKDKSRRIHLMLFHYSKFLSSTAFPLYIKSYLAMFHSGEYFIMQCL